MCRKISLVLAGVLLLASTSSVLAAGPYIGAAGGVSIIHDSDVNYPGDPTVTVSYKTGYALNLSAGYNFDGARVEGEFGYKKADIDKASALGTSVNIDGSDATIMSYMVNGYYDIKTGSAVTPYIGAGLGMINGEMNDNGYKKDDTVLGYQIIAGVGFNVNKNVAIDISYRFQGAAADFNIDGSDVSYMSSNLLGGVRFNF